MFCLTSAIELVRVKIWCVYGKALGMRMQKLVLDLSLAQILPEKINKMLNFFKTLRSRSKRFERRSISRSFTIS